MFGVLQGCRIEEAGIEAQFVEVATTKEAASFTKVAASFTKESTSFAEVAAGIQAKQPHNAA